MPFSTGSPQLDALLEELQAGDNVVFYSGDVDDYRPFARSVAEAAHDISTACIYVRGTGALDGELAHQPGVIAWELDAMAAAGGSVVEALCRRAEGLGDTPVYYVFEPLSSLAPWFGGPQGLAAAFLRLCPLLFRLRSIAYWDVTRGRMRSADIAAIQDCTQVFVRIEQVGGETVLTPLKVWGRYSDTMFQPHRVTLEGGRIAIQPMPAAFNSGEYVRALADKNRELAEIRDALHATNAQLIERNRELEALSRQLAEQGRLYRSLRTNLDNLLALFRAGWDIGASLVLDQVYQAILVGAARLFDVERCALYLRAYGGEAPVMAERGPAPQIPALLAALRENACASRAAQSASATDGVLSAAAAPILVRGECLGTLEVVAPDARLDAEEVRTLLGYLASEASIALDNAHLYRESDRQKAQLRTFVDDTILSHEQESRQVALDLHDGVVQMIVASFQHLQTAKAWRGRDPGVEESELARGVQILQQAIYEARRLIGQLRPAGLDDFGLVHALRAYVGQLSAEQAWQLTLHIDPQWGPLPTALEAGLFRIVQEATNNARKYAEADRVRVALQVDGGDLMVSVEDNGKGFDPLAVAAEPEKGLHIGLIGIRERALLFGGTCVVDSAPGRGATVRVQIPRPAPSNAPGA